MDTKFRIVFASGEEEREITLGKNKDNLKYAL